MIWKFLQALGAKFDYKIEILNIITIFFKSLIEEIVYLKQPYGFEELKIASYDLAYHLLKALYGLKWSLWEYYLTLVDYL